MLKILGMVCTTILSHWSLADGRGVKVMVEGIPGVGSYSCPISRQLGTQGGIEAANAD